MGVCECCDEMEALKAEWIEKSKHHTKKKEQCRIYEQALKDIQQKALEVYNTEYAQQQMVFALGNIAGMCSKAFKEGSDVCMQNGASKTSQGAKET